ncbi:MAG TPA: 2-dehydropantoate 2-reductase [Anaeromyxobacter sp.]|nr:2-dehydropantoate 2-reductase [Anaeromyxobacter sp.]
MRIAIVGAGGVGGLLAALLGRAGQDDVVVVARGAHAEAIRRAGLRLESSLGTFTVRLPVAEDPSAAGRADAVLVAVKAWQVAEVAPRLAPLVAAGGVAVPLQNGVEAAGRLAAALGDERVAGGLVAVLSWIEAPGVVRHVGGAPRLRLGERGPRGGSPSPRLDALAASLRRAGAEVELVADVEAASWEKFLLIEPWGAVAAAARAPAGVVRTVAETRALHLAAMEELAALARARGVAIAPDAVSRTLAFLDGVTPEATASMQRDLGAGRPSELDDQTGAVVRLAREAGVAVPVHEVLYAALVPQERAARGAIPRFTRT